MADRKRGTSTSTSNFGVGKRENHDASAFYSRFTPPVLTPKSRPVKPERVDEIVFGDARSMDAITDGSVALVVTSPPYFAGKAYEEDLGKGHIPSSYFDYLSMLEAVFAECARKLEPGGRIAVNVANLGRRPYRSLSSDVIDILEHQGLLLRGEIIWQKARGAGGNCAWGSFQNAANPVLRDLTERVIVASKGQFERALTRHQRDLEGYPSVNTVFKDEFMEATTDVWEIPPESATRVGHPAPFPVVLPRRLIELYTFEGDLVLDPFIGSGTTAVAAVRTGRHYFGYDTDGNYAASARRRIESEVERQRSEDPRLNARRVHLSVGAALPADDEHFQARAVRQGQKARDIAEQLLTECGFRIRARDKRIAGGVSVNFVAEAGEGRSSQQYYFDVSGAFTSSRPGLRRSDTLWKALGKAAVLSAVRKDAPAGEAPRLIFLTTDLPPRGSAGDAALTAAHRAGVFDDALEMLNPEHVERLLQHASGQIDEVLSLLGPAPDDV